MKVINKIFTLIVPGLLLGCANTGAHYQPIVDGPLSNRYGSDLIACQQLATARSYANDDTKSNAAIGAGLGALAGLADDSVGTAEGLLAGAVVGALAGSGASMLETREQRRQVVITCMRGRGHNVVG
ncbi:MAG: glycine zipper family protein [Gammaproteobacteria bacterium]|nr:glycine zipper family protein [Gammaproteobacteria bacterium]